MPCPPISQQMNQVSMSLGWISGVGVSGVCVVGLCLHSVDGVRSVISRCCRITFTAVEVRLVACSFYFSRSLVSCDLNVWHWKQFEIIPRRRLTFDRLIRWQSLPSSMASTWWRMPIMMFNPIRRQKEEAIRSMSASCSNWRGTLELQCDGGGDARTLQTSRTSWRLHERISVKALLNMYLSYWRKLRDFRYFFNTVIIG